jgi:uncharacterized damage-inducible protein DinB
MMERTIANSIALLLQADGLLDRITPEDLRKERALLFGGTLGQHLRHIIEYYRQLLREHVTGRVSYDRRVRDPGIEQHVHAAREAIRECVGLLRMLDGDRDLVLESELPGEARMVRQCTSLLRELTYVADHGVHHLAMVRIVVEHEMPEVTVPDAMGVAAATRNHRAR